MKKLTRETFEKLLLLPSWSLETSFFILNNSDPFDNIKIVEDLDLFQNYYLDINTNLGSKKYSMYDLIKLAMEAHVKSELDISNMRNPNDYNLQIYKSDDPYDVRDVASKQVRIDDFFKFCKRKRFIIPDNILHTLKHRYGASFLQSNASQVKGGTARSKIWKPTWDFVLTRCINLCEEAKSEGDGYKSFRELAVAVSIELNTTIKEGKTELKSLSSDRIQRRISEWSKDTSIPINIHQK